MPLRDGFAVDPEMGRHLAAPPGKLRVVPLAASVIFRPDADPGLDASVWERYGLFPGSILYVGGLRPHKNVARIVRGHAALLEILRRRHPLVLVGGPVPKELQDLVGDPGTAAWVLSLGVVPDFDLPALYRGAALFVFPSRYEGIGLPVPEAMACGAPVLCSTAPASVELTADAAAHVAPEQKRGRERVLRTLLSDPGRRLAMSVHGLDRAGGFSPRRMTTDILNVPDEVVACHR